MVVAAEVEFQIQLVTQLELVDLVEAVTEAKLQLVRMVQQILVEAEEVVRQVAMAAQVWLLYLTLQLIILHGQ